MARTRHRRLWARAALCGLALPCALLAAPTVSAQEGEGGEVVVTGSRIARPDVQPAAAIETLGPGEIAGEPPPPPTSTLPPVNDAGPRTALSLQGGGAGNGLRGFGPDRHEVLVDGRRPMPSAPHLAIDVAAIPDALIERVEVIGGGAAPAYGQGAVAGAVNIRLKRDFSGLDLRSGVMGGEAPSWQASGLFGADFADSRGHLVAAFDRSQREALRAAQRPGIATRDPLLLPPLERRAGFGAARYRWSGGVEGFAQASGARYDAQAPGVAAAARQVRTVTGQAQAGARGAVPSSTFTWEASLSHGRTVVDETSLGPAGEFGWSLQQEAMELFATGDLPGHAAGPVGIAVGLEHRRRRYAFDPGNGALPRSAGSEARTDLFGEARLPLSPRGPHGRGLELGLGVRGSFDQDGEAVGAYRAELNWSSLPPLRMRLTYQASRRAAEVVERYGVSEATAASFDPCARPAPDAAALCAVVRPGPMVRVGASGLEPERTRVLGAGAVLSNFVSGWGARLRLSLDLFDIRIDDAILAPDPDLLLAACFNAFGANPGLSPGAAPCRAVASGRTAPAGGGKIRVQGLDAQAGWGFDLQWLGAPPGSGSVQATLSVSRLFRFEAAPAGLPAFDYAGTAGGFAAASGPAFPGSAYPRWRASWSAAYLAGGYDVAVRGRYVAAVATRPELRPFADASARAAWYWDLSAGRDISRNLELRGGVNNLTDARPPTFAPDPSVYDLAGRRAYAELRLRF